MKFNTRKSVTIIGHTCNILELSSKIETILNIEHRDNLMQGIDYTSDRETKQRRVGEPNN